MFDILVIGSGLAGLSAALCLAEKHRVALLTKTFLGDGCSRFAQGGIAAVLPSEKTDSFYSHICDTLEVGAGLCDEKVTKWMIEQAPACIAWLQKQGIVFSEEGNGILHRSMEGGHSVRRVLHVADATGEAISRVLVEKVRQNSNITVFERHMLVDIITDRILSRWQQQQNSRYELPKGCQISRFLKTEVNPRDEWNEISPGKACEGGSNESKISKKTEKSMAIQMPATTCFGVYALNTLTGEVLTFPASHTILATGGASKVYLYTTNPDTATGDGLACAWRADCRVANLEFIQFHPTCLYHPQAKSFLISEAVRGEGGRLILPDGTRFMLQHDPRAELAPRDIVARAIDFEMKKHGLDCVFLDISHRSPAFILSHFPTIHARCLDFGIDITRQPIPVVPAAHYICGGVVTDHNGCTDLSGLYAVGEVAYTGFHGGNRLASNSLLECVVSAIAASRHIISKRSKGRFSLRGWDNSQVTNPDEMVEISHNWDELRRLMWNYVGIVRTDLRLEKAMRRIELLKSEMQEIYTRFHVTQDLLELRNLVCVAELIIRCSQKRKESRGLHFNRDHPLMGEGEVSILCPESRVAEEAV